MTEETGRHVERLQRMKGNPANRNAPAFDALNAAVASLKAMDQLRELVYQFDTLNETALAKLDESKLNPSEHPETSQAALREASVALGRGNEVSQEILDLIRKSG